MNVTKTVCVCATICAFNVFPGEDAPKPKPVEAVKPAPVAEKPAADDPVLKMLIEIASADAAVREAAAKTFLMPLQDEIKKSTKTYARKMNEDLASDDAARRAGAAKELAVIIEDIRKNKTTDAFLIDHFRKVNIADEKSRNDSRAQLVRALDVVIENKLVDKLIGDLGSTDLALVDAAEKKLIEIGGDAASQLADALEDERLAVKKKAGDILKAMGPQAKDAVTDLVFLMDSEDKAARRTAASVLEGLGPLAVDALDDLVEYLQSDEKPVRRLSANIIKKMGEVAKTAAPDLVELLSHEEKGVRGIAVELLQNLGPHAGAVANELLEIVDQKPGEDDDQRERAATVLGTIAGEAKETLPGLRKHLTDEHPGVKAAVEIAIKKIEEGKPLEKASGEKKPAVK